MVSTEYLLWCAEYLGWVSTEYLGLRSTDFLGWASTAVMSEQGIPTADVGWVSMGYII